MATFLATGEGLAPPDSKPLFQGKLFVSLDREKYSYCLLFYMKYGMAVDKIATVQKQSILNLIYVIYILGSLCRIWRPKIGFGDITGYKIPKPCVSPVNYIYISV